MATYFISFVLFAFLALENNNIFNRLHAHSHPSGDTDIIAPFVRQYQYRQHAQLVSNHHPTHDQHHTHHARKHVQQHQRHNVDNGEAGGLDTEAIRDMERVKRHMQRQWQHRQEQERRLQQHPQEQLQGDDRLRTMPRLWQHLSAVYDEVDESESDEGMYGDEPLEISEEIDLEAIELPLDVERTVGASSHKKLVTEEADQLPIEPARAKATPCPKCESNRKVEAVTEDELTRLRIEYVKKQILEKLRLKEPPNVDAVSLPKPITEGVTLTQEEEEEPAKKDVEDYYARVSKKFIFLEVEKDQCLALGVKPSMCFSFKLDDKDVDGYQVSKAVLWIFKNKHQRMAHASNQTIPFTHTIVISEVQQRAGPDHRLLAKPIAVKSVDEQDEWMKVDIEWPINRWIGSHQLNHLIQITCQSCDISSMEHIISTDQDYRPFIVLDTQSRRRQARQKRNINCADGVKECCREKLYISFDDIGWGNWIIHPRGYDAYFCRGSCNSVASVTNSLSRHSTVLQKVLNKPGQRHNHLELVPCCTPKTYTSLELLFSVGNGTISQMKFPEMVVESCGCR